MHIPDGFLDFKTAASSGAISLLGVGAALRQARVYMPPRRVPLMGVSAAFIFAAQMLNFPVFPGVSGHLVGGVLAAVLLGPSAAIVVMAAVLLVQCFVFQDGGVTALGANMFNMGLIGAGAGYLIYRGLMRLLRGCHWPDAKTPKGAEQPTSAIIRHEHGSPSKTLAARGTLPGHKAQLVAVAIASWCATVIAAIACAGELALSGRVSWGLAFPALAGVHAVIGIGEAVITTLIVFAVAQARPELIEGTDALRPRAGRRREILIFGALIALGMALFVSPFACRWPDGLDHFAETVRLQTHALLPALMKDYRFPGIRWEPVATGIAGAVGAAAALVLGLGVARVLARRRGAVVEAAPAPVSPVDRAGPEGRSQLSP